MAGSSEDCIASRPVDDGPKTDGGELDWLQQSVAQLMTRMRIAVIFGSNKTTPGSVLYQTSNTRSWKSYEAVARDIALSLERIGFRHVQLMPDDMRLGDRLRASRSTWPGSIPAVCKGTIRPPTLHPCSKCWVCPMSVTIRWPATTLDNKHAFKREAVCAGHSDCCVLDLEYGEWSLSAGPQQPVQVRLRRLCRTVHRQAGFRARIPACPRRRRPRRTAGHGRSNLSGDRQRRPDREYLSGREFCIGVAGRSPRGSASWCVAANHSRSRRSSGPSTPDEKIFTSMDTRPITQDRFKQLDPVRDGALLQRMRRLACEIYREFNLSSLIRLDLRSDEHGNLHVLEANPKPDLKQPAEGVTSLISAGLSECGMDYDDLIFSLIADRLDYLFTHRREAVGHILELLEPRKCALAPTERASVMAQCEKLAASAEHIKDAMSAIAAMARQQRGSGGRRHRANQRGRRRNQPARAEILVPGIGDDARRGATSPSRCSLQGRNRRGRGGLKPALRLRARSDNASMRLRDPPLRAPADSLIGLQRFGIRFPVELHVSFTFSRRGVDPDRREQEVRFAMVESSKLGRRIVDAVSMFIVTVLSLLLLLYVGYGEGRRTYEQIELEKLTAQAYLIQNTIEKFLRDDLPLKQFPGFATIARPLVDGLADVDAMAVYDHDRRQLFFVKDKSDPKLPPPSEAIGRVKRDIEIETGDTHYQVVVPLRTRFETAGALVIMSRTDAVSGRLQQAFLPLLFLVGGLAAVFAVGITIAAPYLARTKVPWLQIGFSFTFVLMAAALVYTLTVLYFRRRKRQGRNGDVHFLAALQ
jgi:D-alanine-D-alanine ligase